MDAPKLNGKSWLQKGLIQIIMILSLVAYGAVMTVREFSGAPRSVAGDRANSNTERIIALETCMKALEHVPTDVAGIKVSVGALKESVDEIKRSIVNSKR